MSRQHIVIVGSGALAGSTCRALASLPVRVTILARNQSAASAIAPDCPGSAVGDLDDLEQTLARLRPELVVCLASAQSPYEKNLRPSRWTRLVEEAGFGLTLPLQALVLARVARALSPETLLINGCFPDAVNPMLAAAGLPVFCGIGNVATLATCLQVALGLPDQRGLAVLGHHVHLAEPEVRAWLDGEPVPDVSALLAPYRARPRRELNAIAGQAAGSLLAGMVTGAEIFTNLPGPLGLPGGYPVRLAGGAITLNLPAGVSQADAIAWNTDAGRGDGIEIRDGWVGFTATTAETLAPHLPEIAAGWACADFEKAGDLVLALRDRLRA